MSAPRCTHHCRGCDQHFTSLQAFDAHRTGPMDARECLSAVGAGLVARSGGVCVVSDPDVPQTGQTIFEHRAATQIREHHQAVSKRAER